MKPIKIQRMLNIYKGKLETANDFNQHADALRAEGAVSALETLLIYAEEEDIKNIFSQDGPE